MTNIKEVSFKQETGNEYIKRVLANLEEDDCVLEDVVILATHRTEPAMVFNSEMHSRDLAFLNVTFNNWIKDNL